jgi:transcriptional regulator of arginine metabolism
MTSSKTRRLVLRQLLLGGQTGTQQELCEHLAEKGFASTQSTVSRDLKVLGAQRLLREDGHFAYHLRGNGRGAFPSEMILAVDHNETTIVVRTKVGRAQAVGLDIDDLKHADILGTLAGDDTVLVVPRSVKETLNLARSLRELAGLED